jgi:hypothetical protein
MSAALIEKIATQGVFQPRRNFIHLAQDHVPFDDLVGEEAYESTALSRATEGTGMVGVVGPRGAGKSSLIAYVCSQLPETHVALRIPVTGADDPTSVSVVAAVALSQALDDLDLEQYQREALERPRADETARETQPGGLRGGTLGGGPVPGAVHAELATLREQVTTNRLASERLGGLDRLITILVARRLNPVFVLEDTEAAIGGADSAKVADAFLRGPVQAFANELDAVTLIAMQDVFKESPEFAQLTATMSLIEIPRLDTDRSRTALAAIMENRLNQHELESRPEQVVGDDAFELLLGFYDETDRNLRFSLAALQSAAEYANDMRAECIRGGHMRAATSDWRDRIAG